MAKPIELKVHLAYDEDADRWYVAASDVPGLRLEAESPYVLMERVAAAAGELIELNEGEIIKKRVRRDRPAVAWKPVFDSPLQLAHA